MTRIPTWALFAGLVATFGVLALAGSSAKGAQRSYQRVRGLPSGRGVTWQVNPNGIVVPLVDGQSVVDGLSWGANQDAPPYTAAEKTLIQRMQRVQGVLNEGFAARQSRLPADASPWAGDRYSKELYWLPRWGSFTPREYSMVIPIPHDEFGRVLPGEYGGPGGLWNATIGNLYANPLGAAVINIAIIAGTGGAGVAVIGAYSMWRARGEDLTLKNIALQAGRAYVVSQCGEACGMAFDFGVGVASGEDVDTAAENALLKQMTPEQRAAYDEGKKLYKGMTS